MKTTHLLSLIAAGTLAACAPVTSQTAPGSAASVSGPAQGGTVSAADPRASEAGMDMLRAGGSAADAAIATMLALTVVEPQSSGIGGGGFAVRGTGDGSVESWDGRETAPAGATPEWFLNPDGSVPEFQQSQRSGLSVGVPGNIALAAKLHAAHGKLEWAQLFAPAIALARDGFRMNPRLHDTLARMPDHAGHTAQARGIYFDTDGQALPVGTLVRNPALAATLERIAAQGPDAFYQGDAAKELATAVAAETPRSGAMSVADVEGYDAKARPPLCGHYRGYRICTMGPPTSGGIAVLQMLGQLERFDLAALGQENPVTWHLFLESQRLAYADRELYAADADFVPVPAAGLIDPAYLAQRSALIDPARSMASVSAGRPAGAPPLPGDGDEPEEHGTSHIAVAGGDGTMISYTTTIESAFGSGLMVGGFYLNNELTDFSRAPRVDGRLVANRVQGGKRPRSSMAPAMVWDPSGRPVLVVGAAGGGTIPVQTARSIIGVIDFGLDAEQAVGMPFIMAFGDNVMVEKGTWLEGAIPALQALGHTQIAARDAPVKANAAKLTDGRWVAGRDPRIEQSLILP